MIILSINLSNASPWQRKNIFNIPLLLLCLLFMNGCARTKNVTSPQAPASATEVTHQKEKENEEDTIEDTIEEQGDKAPDNNKKKGRKKQQGDKQGKKKGGKIPQPSVPM
jgi:hypothetical protein